MLDQGAELYLRLLKRCLTREIFPDRRWNSDLTQHLDYDAELRKCGRDWPTQAESMVGSARLDNLELCIRDVVLKNIPGDLVETGVWRGGCGILMRGVLKAYACTDRLVWLADSFQGLPSPSPEMFPLDKGDRHSELTPYLGVSLQAVKENFSRYELLDHQVRFLPGWFHTTLPTAPIKQIAVLRLDGDMYESTFVALSALYRKVSPGGYVIVDDFGALPNCRAAVEDFRASQRIADPIVPIDWTGVYWRLSA